jgi:hypothetical protein
VTWKRRPASSLLDRLTAILERGLATLPAIEAIHPATRRLLANWGYHYEVWSLRRFAPVKRHAIVLRANQMSEPYSVTSSPVKVESEAPNNKVRASIRVRASEPRSTSPLKKQIP